MSHESQTDADSEDDTPLLNEVELHGAPRVLSLQASSFLRDGRSRYKQIDCFDFVPSNYENAWNVLSGLPRGSFCEWGCGLGIAVGLAEILGFEASGIEIDPELAESARGLLRDHNLKAQITTGSYFDSHDVCDYHYVYCWPGQIPSVEKRFSDMGNDHAKLLICYGQDDIRCKVLRSSTDRCE
ncbi:MAG: hypothetical protein NTU79_00630 [Planctomycetota bacterium]|nr:hypothetical protein [Planctomycetota bacterium]